MIKNTLILLITIFSIANAKNDNASVIATNQHAAAKTTQNNTLKTNKTIKIVAVGDIMIGADYPENRLPPDDGQNSFAKVKSALVGDVVFGNLEGVLADTGESQKCKNAKAGHCYAFRMPERYGKIIKDAGFNVLSVANNHANDLGDFGRFNTSKVLKNLGIAHAGLQEMPCTDFTKDGVRYGFCAFAPNFNMISINDSDATRTLVGDLAKKVDIMIVSFHGGAEGGAYTRVPRTQEIFHGEDRGNVYQFAHDMIDVGADVVLGHGPHVVRGMELYKGKIIAYSLGNFNTYGWFNLDDGKSLAPILHINTDITGNFLHGKIVSAKQSYSDGVALDPNQGAFLKIARLSALDFYHTAPKFKDGAIIKR